MKRERQVYKKKRNRGKEKERERDLSSWSTRGWGQGGSWIESLCLLGGDHRPWYGNGCHRLVKGNRPTGWFNAYRDGQSSRRCLLSLYALYIFPLYPSSFTSASLFSFPPIFLPSTIDLIRGTKIIERSSRAQSVRENLRDAKINDISIIYYSVDLCKFALEKNKFNWWWKEKENNTLSDSQKIWRRFFCIWSYCLCNEYFFFYFWVTIFCEYYEYSLYVYCFNFDLKIIPS